MAHGSFPIDGEEVYMTDDLARNLGFINLAAYENYKRKREDVTIDKLLVEVVNLQQMVLDCKKHIESLDRRLSATGVERIGGAMS